MLATPLLHNVKLWMARQPGESRALMSVLHNHAVLATKPTLSSCLSSAVIVATTRHDVEPQSSGGEQICPSIFRLSSSPAHPTTGPAWYDS